MMGELVLNADAIYDIDAIPRMTGLTVDAVDKARRSGHLKAVKRGRKWFVRGEALIHWLTSESSDQVGNSPIDG